MISIEQLRTFYHRQGVPTILEESFELLLKLVEEQSPQSILEVGTATATSSIAMALVCPTAKVSTIEIRENSFLQAKENVKKFDLEDRISLYLGDSLDVIDTLDQKFDFVFLDGAKSKYKQNLQKIEPLLKEGATVVADNVLYRGYVEGLVPFVRRQKTIVVNMRAFLDYVFNGEKYLSKLYRIGDGVSVSYYKGEKL